MIRKGLMSRRAVVLAVFMAVIFLVSGCSALKSKDGPAASTPVRSSANKQNAPLYYDFGDVLLPSELKINTDETFIYRTPGMTAGVMSLSGRIEVSSLITFFENKMPVDGWRPISSFRAPRTMMLFSKQNRWCVISITESSFSTHVEIWVAPAIESAGGGWQRG
jgi:hypothetical protein